MFGTLLLIHLLAATIWTGGHLVLAIVVLPRVLRERSPTELMRFEAVYEKIGMPALIAQIITGLMLAHRLLPDVSEWFNYSNPLAAIITAKLALLGFTAAFAVDAKLRVIPHLSPDSLKDMAWHIVPVTVFSVLFVVAGASFRTGWFF